MNKVIEGRRYDTDTAKFVGESDEVYARKTELYRKKNGEFFMLHWTRWNNEKDEIVPLSLEEAKEWVAKNLDADMYADLFGPVAE